MFVVAHVHASGKHMSRPTLFKMPFPLSPTRQRKLSGVAFTLDCYLYRDAFVRELGALEFGLHTTLASTLQRACATLNVNGKLGFQCEGPFNTRHGMELSSHQGRRSRYPSYSFVFQLITVRRFFCSGCSIFCVAAMRIDSWQREMWTMPCLWVAPTGIRRTRMGRLLK